MMKCCWRLKPVTLLLCLLAASQLDAQGAEHSIDRSLVLDEFDIPIDGDELLVPVRIGDRDCVFCVDTGAYCSVFDVTLTPLLGPPRETRSEATPLGSVEATFYSPPPFMVGTTSVSIKGRVACLSLDDMRKVSGQHQDGVLGMDVLSQFVVRLDFDRGKLTLLKEVGSPEGQQLWIGNPRMPTIEARFPGLPPKRFLIDTGHIASSSGSIHSTWHTWLQQHDQLTSAGKSNLADASGKGRGRLGVVSRCSIGGFEFANTMWSENKGNVPNHVSLYFLTQFNVTFDFPHSTMYLTKNEHYGHADAVDLSGLHFLRTNGQVVVEFVDKGSVAEHCGIRRKDIIKSVSGVDASHARLFTIRHTLSRPGERVSVVVERGSTRLEKELTLTGTAIARETGPTSAAR